MKELKSMNDMTMEELLATEAAINRQFFEEASFLHKLREEKGDDPPEWAIEIDDDEKFQQEMGAEELWIECKNCGIWVKSVSSFCNNQCKKQYIARKKLEAQFKQANKMRRMMK